MGPVATVYGGSAGYYSMGEFWELLETKTSGISGILLMILRGISARSFGRWTNSMCRMWRDMDKEACKQEYTSEDQVFWGRFDVYMGIRFELIDCNTGKVIVLGVIGVTGYII